jgi:hypothetical protein
MTVEDSGRELSARLYNTYFLGVTEEFNEKPLAKTVGVPARYSRIRALSVSAKRPRSLLPSHSLEGETGLYNEMLPACEECTAREGKERGVVVVHSA